MYEFYEVVVKERPGRVCTGIALGAIAGTVISLLTGVLSGEIPFTFSKPEADHQGLLTEYTQKLENGDMLFCERVGETEFNCYRR